MIDKTLVLVDPNLFDSKEKKMAKQNASKAVEEPDTTNSLDLL